jgi:hypothetical protein
MLNSIPLTRRWALHGTQRGHKQELTYTNMNSKWIKDRNIIDSSRKAGIFHNTEFGNAFLDMIPNRKVIKKYTN